MKSFFTLNKSALPPLNLYYITGENKHHCPLVLRSVVSHRCIKLQVVNLKRCLTYSDRLKYCTIFFTPFLYEFRLSTPRLCYVSFLGHKKTRSDWGRNLNGYYEMKKNIFVCHSFVLILPQITKKLLQT
jgi:hypothetical protein